MELVQKVELKPLKVRQVTEILMLNGKTNIYKKPVLYLHCVFTGI